MKYLVILTALFIGTNCFSQQKKTKEDRIKSKALYLAVDTTKAKVEFFESENSDGAEALAMEHSFFLKKDYCKIWMTWMNPLKYTTSWSDSTYQDDRDKAINEFTNLLVKQFGVEELTLDKNKIDSEYFIQENIDTLNLEIYLNQNDKKNNKLLSLDTLFFNFELNELYWKLEENVEVIDNTGGLKAINSILRDLVLVDNYLAMKKSKKIEELFITLVSTTNMSKAKKIVSDIEEELNKQKVKLENLKKQINKIPTKMEFFKFKTEKKEEKRDEARIKHYIKTYIEEAKAVLARNEGLITNLEKAKDIVKKSYMNAQEEDNKFYVESHTIDFEPGEMMSSTLKIEEHTYDMNTKEFKTKKTIYSSKFLFKKYEWVEPRVGTGLFYSTATLRGYGVATNDNNELTVSEDNIQKSSPVTGLFLNLNFNLNTRYFAPTIELGIDPTKTRPYLLLGGGFIIPAANFGITFGGIWTFEQTLSDYRVGDVVESTSALENDISYKFNVNPLGVYIGLKYEFGKKKE